MDPISYIYLGLFVFAMLVYFVVLRPNLKEQERRAKLKTITNKKSS